MLACHGTADVVQMFLDRRDFRIVRIEDYLDRAQALSAAGLA